MKHVYLSYLKNSLPSSKMQEEVSWSAGQRAGGAEKVGGADSGWGTEWAGRGVGGAWSGRGRQGGQAIKLNWI